MKSSNVVDEKQTNEYKKENIYFNILHGFTLNNSSKDFF